MWPAPPAAKQPAPSKKRTSPDDLFHTPDLEDEDEEPLAEIQNLYDDGITANGTGTARATTKQQPKKQRQAPAAGGRGARQSKAPAAATKQRKAAK